MRAGVAWTALLLLILHHQVLTAEDLYWEGEEDASNEFLEVKDDSDVMSHLRRLKRGFFDFWSPFSTTTPSPENYEVNTEDEDDTIFDNKDDDDRIDADGSGAPDKIEPDVGEKTLRVTFVVMEPYRDEYSNRDSVLFQNFSRTLADAVNLLFEKLPGTQKASLVRIQSRLVDEFSCKVTLDIVTTGFDDTNRITEVLRDHIKKFGKLGRVTVKDIDFSANVVNPGSAFDICQPDEIQCSDGRCVPGHSRCNGYRDCSDGADEADCNIEATPEETYQGVNSPETDARRDDSENRIDHGRPDEESVDRPVHSGLTGASPDQAKPRCSNPIPCASSSITVCPEQICDGTSDCPLADDENNCGTPRGDQSFQTTTPRTEEEQPPPNQPEACPAGEMRCDETRCIPANKRCDGENDCFDGTDEAGCKTEQCGGDDFRCNNGKCIEASKRCDSVVDCPDREDEVDCSCSPDEFQCLSDGACIEGRKRCDNVQNCRDGSDEQDCECPADMIACDKTSSVRCAYRCNNKPECDDEEDEEDCDDCQHECDNKCLSADLICNRVRDCSDGSDEENCDNCDGPSDFRCDNDDCISITERCNGVPECTDGSDERYCNSTIITTSNGCLEDQFKCRDGTCINKDFRCDRRADCNDASDEEDCDCASDEFTCSNRQCIPNYLRCDSRPDCSDGSDEDNCSPYYPPTPPVQTTTSRYDDRYIPGRGSYGTTARPSNRYDPYGTNRRPDGRTDENPEAETPIEATTSRRPDENGGEYDPYGPTPDPYGRDSNRYPDNTNDINANYPPTSAPYDPYGSVPSTPQPSYPQPSDPYGTTTQPPSYPQPDPYGSAGGRPGSGYPQPGSDPYGGVDSGTQSPYPQPGGSDPYASGSQPGYPQPGGDPYDNGSQPGYPQPGGDPYASGSQPGYPQPGGDPYASGSQPGYPQPGGDPYASGSQPGGSYPQPGGDPYASGSQPGYPQPGGGDSSRTGTGSGSDYPQPVGPGITGGSVRGPVTLNVKTYPTDQSVRFGGDVVFQCRDEGPLRAPVRWVREGGRPLKPGFTERNGRLELFNVTTADAGIYICQTPSYLRYSGSQVRVTLTVQRPDSVSARIRPPFKPCRPHEATCGNGDCIPKSAVCDGNYDCADRSDEEMCKINGFCEPNEFQCPNRKCILFTWKCDGDDDCGDGSDEEDCGPSDPSSPCRPNEYACKTNQQCIPRSFHCDGRADCMDGSDEIGCAPIYITRPPKPANVRLNPGDTLSLTCEAVGIPTPTITWRLNWGRVPDKCIISSKSGIGNLTCPNMQPENSGAYSCEAMNNKATLFAVPDAIVFVSKTDPCPNGYFNSEARSESECIRCFCFGESTQCKSADLFTYNMPTPLGEGGTRLLGVALTADGEIRTDPSIINHYYYQPLRNGAAVTTLNPRAQDLLGNFHPFLTLPETYNGNQLTSYGGHIKYTLEPHTRAYMPDDAAPAIIIKGKYATLFHNRRSDPSREQVIEVRLTPENWQKNSTRGFIPASREDIMMALDHIDMILLRADLNNAGVNITDFVMESAHHINSGFGAASLVEECTCPPGYEGLSCQKCAAGYVRERSGPWLGNCVREECPPGTYGDPASGYACRPCPCPLTNRDNQFARTCSLGPDGAVQCDCFPGYQGRNCEVCAPGYEGNPLVPGDSCRVRPTDNCNPVGTRQVRLLDECVCKDHVQGRYCDQCKNDSFYLSNDFRHGCALCFCSGVSQQCMSSNLRRKTTTVQFNVPAIVDQVKIYNSAPAGNGAVRYTAPVETNIRPILTSGGLGPISNYDSSRPTVRYWSMPISFSGDKVTSYGGYLRYTLYNVPSYIDSRMKNNAADVQLISDNHLTFQYVGNFQANPEGILNASVQFLEKGWTRSDGKELSREHFLLALADVKTILIKGTYSMDSVALPLMASIETAEPGGDGPAALHVEQCVCPVGHIGTSCEDCAPGYTRTESGLYLEHCGPCQCNGHSRNCHPETGVCYECMDNTDGPQCELCKPGYERDAYDNCVYTGGTPQTNTDCRCDPRGESGPCSEDGRCNCKPNVEGENCDRCRAGTFGLDGKNPYGCTPCFCSGVTTDCQEAKHYTKNLVPAPIFGDKFGGYTIMDINAEHVYGEEFVPVPDKSELMYIFKFPATTDLYWSLPVFPGNRVLSYNGSLYLRQEFRSNDFDEISRPGVDVVLIGDDVSLYWSNPNRIRSEQSLNYAVPLVEDGWFLLNTATPASRSDFMRVLKNLRRVLVRATIADNLVSTSIADVSMETATETPQPGAPTAKGIEICSCPPGHLGSSCESCVAGYYKDNQDYCTVCPCNGHDCQLDPYGEVSCNCQPPYTGSDCSAIVGDNYQTTTPRQPPNPPPSPPLTVRITSPTIMIQEIGSSVNFTCQAQSAYTNQRLPINWSKVDGNLPQGRTYIDHYAGLLTITNLQISDSGQYICETHDGLSTGQALVTLKVPANDMSLPSVTINPPVNDYYEGDRIQLECVATGNPTPTITWQRASRRPLPMSSEHFNVQFVIESARVEDSGEYRCIASNTAGSADRTAVISVRPRPSYPPRDRLMVTPTEPTVNEGQSTRVVCTGSTNVPAGTIDWIRQDGDRFQPNVRSDNGVLYIDNAMLENQGVYICQSHAADVAPVPIVVNIVPQGTPPPGQQPEIDVPIKSLKVPTGESGTVDCVPRGYPLPQVRWTKYQGEFGRGTSQRGDTLIINNAEENDAGYYVCEGIVDNQVINKIYVLVEIERREAPRVQIWPEGEQPVALGSQFEFHCRVIAGIPDPAVTWSRSGGRRLSPDTHIKQNNVLSFDSVDVNDEGEYVCTASNNAGADSASAVLKVRSPPVINITPTNYIEINNGDSKTVECRANGYPEPLVSIRGPSGETISEPAPGIAVLRIESASEREQGDYTCTATSAAGTTTDTFIIRVDRGDGGFTDFGGSGENEIIPNSNYNPYPERPSDLIAAEGQREISIYCNVSSGLLPQWSRADRQPLQYNARQDGNRLVIYNVSKSDSGEYVCSVYNYETREAQNAAYTSLRVVGAPRITLRPQKQTVSPGQSPTVECVVEGDNIIDVNWKPYNRNLSRRVRIRNSTLIFQQIEVEDAGKYECVARNPYANASAIAEVIVEESEVASEYHGREVTVRTGAAVSLSCAVEGAGAGAGIVRWTKDGHPVPRSVRLQPDGSLFIRTAHRSDSGHYVCYVRDDRNRLSNNYVDLHIEGPQEGVPALIRIEQPMRRFRAGENVEVLCRTVTRGTNVRWDKWDEQGTRQYVESRTYGDGAILIIRGVTEGDAGVYRCTGYDPYGRSSSEDFNLVVEPGSGNPYPRDRDVQVAKYEARLGQTVDMPCNHDLEEPVSIKWRREYAPLPSEARSDQPILHIPYVNEGDAGTYVCRVSNSHTAIEAKAILRVIGVVPLLKGNGWIALPTLKDAYRQFDIEISFRPQDSDGLILYNSQYPQRQTDFLALQTVEGVPEFILDTGNGPVSVKGDRPLQLNEWHTIRLSKIGTRVTMNVDNTGPFVTDTTENWVLELQEPLYIGGVPNYDNLPIRLAGAAGYAGCISMLVLGNEEKNIILDAINKYEVYECDTCSPNRCLNDAVCQEARNDRGYICLCANGFAGPYCERRGEACRPGLCGSGKCTDTTDGYKCACPVTHTGRNCEIRQNIEYPAFTGSAYLALKPPNTYRFLKMSMKVKATAPVTDGIIMYCAESARGLGGFTSLAVRNGRLEFRYDLGEGTPVVLISNTTLPANEWTDVQITRSGQIVSLVINVNNKYEQRLDSANRSLRLETPMFVGGVDESIILNNNTGVTSGFMGCIKQLKTHNIPVDIVNSSIQSANVQECSADRGDIPEIDSPCPCNNGGTCASDGSCICPSGFTGYNCETRLPSSLRNPRRPQAEPCAANPCRNGGSCRTDYSNNANYSCDCPLGFGGSTCQMHLELHQSVGFNGNGYLELPASLVNYEYLDQEPAIIALAVSTTQDGVLLYQREALATVDRGDFIMIRIDRGYVVLEWDMGSGTTRLTIDETTGFVTDGERHQIIVKLLADNKVELTVDSNTVSGYTVGISNLMNADSNIYIGGIPDSLNLYKYPGLIGCIEQIEFMNAPRGLDLGTSAVTGRNAQRCRQRPGRI